MKIRIKFLGFFVISLFCYFIISNFANAWYSNDFDYRLAISVNNQDNLESLSDYQVKITLTDEQADFWSRVKDDGSDIRLVDSNDSTLLDFWLKSFDYAGNFAEVWVQVPQISALSEKTIYLYFGNSSVVSVSSFNNAMESSPLEFWTKNYDSGRGNDQAKSVKFLSTGEMVVAGNYINSSDNNDWRLAKYDDDGELIWARNFGFTGGEIKDIAIDSLDNIIAVGYYTAVGDKNWYVRKYDKDGNILWSKIYDLGTDEEAGAIAIDSFDNVIVGGYVTNTNKDWYIRKYDSVGRLMTDFDYNSGLGDDVLFDLAVDSLDNIIAVGNSATLSSQEFFVEKLDSDLIEDWSNSYEKGTNDYFTAVEVDSNDNIFLGGYYSEADSNWILRKLDSEGNLEWDRLYDSDEGNDYLYGLTINSKDEILILGNRASNLEKDLQVLEYTNDGDLNFSLSEDLENDESYFGGDFNNNDDFVLAGYFGGDWLIKVFGDRKYSAIEPSILFGGFGIISEKRFNSYVRFNADSKNIKYVLNSGKIAFKFTKLPENPSRYWVMINKIKQKPNYFSKSMDYYWRIRTNLFKKAARPFKMKFYFSYANKKLKKNKMAEKDLRLYWKDKNYIEQWEKKEKINLKKRDNNVVAIINSFSNLRNWCALAKKYRLTLVKNR